MNNLRHKILSILLIPIVLFSTTSFSVDKHLCSDMVYSMSFLGEAEDCGMEMKNCDEKTSDLCVISNEDCCENELQIISGSITEKHTPVQLSTEQSLFLTYFSISTYYLFKSVLNKTNLHKDYSPPTVLKDIPSLFQVFII